MPDWQEITRRVGSPIQFCSLATGFAISPWLLSIEYEWVRGFSFGSAFGLSLAALLVVLHLLLHHDA